MTMGGENEVVSRTGTYQWVNMGESLKPSDAQPVAILLRYVKAAVLFMSVFVLWLTLFLSVTVPADLLCAVFWCCAVLCSGAVLSSVL